MCMWFNSCPASEQNSWLNVRVNFLILALICKNEIISDNGESILLDKNMQPLEVAELQSSGMHANTVDIVTFLWERFVFRNLEFIF